MMSLQQIQDLSREKAAEAAERGLEPFIVDEVDIERFKDQLETGQLSFPFPFIGDYVPDGWETDGDPLFVDATGLGSESEPAMTVRAFIHRLRPGIGYAIVEAGQFQVYVQAYVPVLTGHIGDPEPAG